MTNNYNVLIVDDEVKILSSLNRLLSREGYAVFSAESASDGIRVLKSEKIHLIICDQRMPETDGITFLEMASSLSPDSVRILLTGYASMDSALEAINRSHVFSFLTKPWSNEILITTVNRACEHLELILENRRFQEEIKSHNNQLIALNNSLAEKVKERTIQLEEALDEGVFMLANAAETKDSCTGDHISRVRGFVLDICSEMGFPNYEAEKTALFSILHDVGKIHTPDAILNKPGPLDDREWEIMKAHTVAGEKILGNKDFYKTAREIARSHHENYDGTGYPDGLYGDRIPLPARIVAVADVYDALSIDRPYKKAWTHDRIMSEMTSLAGKKFDPQILKIFLSIIDKKHIKTTGLQ